MKAVDVLRMAESICHTLADNDIEAKDVRNIQMYDEWKRMRSEGHKYSYIIYYLTTQYDISESGIMRIVKRLDKDIEL